MIFQRLTLQDFRQFEGEQELEFATDGQQNVTVIHGYNGSGKTTLLNAFVWLFYGTCTPDFTAPDRLANEAKWSEITVGEEIDVRVEARFEHRDTTYIAERVRTVEKLDGGERNVKNKGELTLKYVDEQGELQPYGGPEDTIRQLLPEPLYPFFFFNGERIEQLASPDAYDQVETGIKVLLDIEILERAIRHLEGKPADELREEIAESAGNEGQKVRNERRELERQKEALEEKREKLREERNAKESERERIDEKLRAKPRLAKLQERRLNTEDELEETKHQLSEARDKLSSVVSSDGYLALVDDVLDDAGEILDDAHERGELPPAVRRQFVDDLLKDEACICGRELEEGTDARERIEKWRKRAGSGRTAERATAARADLDALEKRAEEFQEELEEIQERRDSLSQKKKTLQEKLSELTSEIGDQAVDEDYQALETRRHKIDDKVASLKLDIKQVDEDIEEVEDQLDDKDDEIQEIEQADERGKQAQRRLRAVQNVVHALKHVRDARKDDLRRDISETLNRIWNDVSIKSYTAALDREYRLRLTKSVGDEDQPVRGASTGEKQVLSLAFVSSLVEKAKQAADDSGSGLFTGGMYPLVMDSPFGSLEVEYRREVASWVPKLAPQIVIIASETQWRNEVEEEVTPRIGREWILECHTPKHSGKNIELHGREYPYVVESNDGQERTKFTEVEI
jgi:DNA sulfur modification protein DndD